jgi:hypothetical protein
MKTFQVSAKLKLFVTTEVQAKSLEEALEKSRTFKEQEFVTILGDYLDGSMEITGIYE